MKKPTIAELKAEWHELYSRLARYDKRTNIEGRYGKMQEEIDFTKITLMHTPDPEQRERCWQDIDQIRKQQIELYRLRRVDDEPDAKAGRNIAVARKKGTQANSAKAEEKARRFQAVFKCVVDDQACAKWSRDAQIDEAIKRLKSRKIRIGKRSAYDYLKPKE
jgi:hypothetical protein